MPCKWRLRGGFPGHRPAVPVPEGGRDRVSSMVLGLFEKWSHNTVIGSKKQLRGGGRIKDLRRTSDNRCTEEDAPCVRCCIDKDVVVPAHVRTQGAFFAPSSASEQTPMCHRRLIGVNTPCRSQSEVLYWSILPAVPFLVRFRGLSMLPRTLGVALKQFLHVIHQSNAVLSGGVVVFHQYYILFQEAV